MSVGAQKVIPAIKLKEIATKIETELKVRSAKATVQLKPEWWLCFDTNVLGLSNKFGRQACKRKV